MYIVSLNAQNKDGLGGMQMPKVKKIKKIRKKIRKNI